MTSLFPETEDQPQPNRAASQSDIGAQLAAARTQADLSTEEVARSLHLSPHHIRALEINNYDAMPAPTFVRGYIRAYAKLLTLNGDELIAEFDAIGASDPELVSTTGGHHDQVDSAHPWMVWASLGIAFLFLLLLAGWWQSLNDQNQSEFTDTEPNNEPVTELDLSNQAWVSSENDLDTSVETIFDDDPLLSTESVVLQSSVESINESQAQSLDVQVDIDTAPNTSMQPSLAQTSPAAAESSPVAEQDPATSEAVVTTEQGFVPETPAIFPVITPQALIPADSDQLTLITENESWIEVRDAEERVLMYSLYTKLGSIRLRGTAPFYVFLGNAPSVKVAINGTPMKLNTFIRGNRTAKFVIDESGVKRP